ncbi:TetR/AcrR family transcriptional regulator [Frigidibacter sp. MR17.24]|uniref:TetR/AcrR family transcriptional regulator n=1 Tax=Frigidibacter sp. MR17.24 TaxID=3127345 RepID=UPI003012E198
MAAIEQVVRRDGLAGLSIDAVAREAGISKSSVIYDFESKAAMLVAFTRAKLDVHREHQMQACEARPEGPDRWLCSLLEVARRPPSADDVTAAMVLSAGVAADDECRGLVRGFVDQDLARICDEARDRDAALLAYLAFFGLKSLEHFGFRDIDAEFRNRCLDAIQTRLLPEHSCGTDPTGPVPPPSSTDCLSEGSQ